MQQIALIRFEVSRDNIVSLVLPLASSGLYAFKHTKNIQSIIIRYSVKFQKSIERKYSVLPHITDKHMRFSPPPANTSGGYTLI